MTNHEITAHQIAERAFFYSDALPFDVYLSFAKDLIRYTYDRFDVSL